MIQQNLFDEPNLTCLARLKAALKTSIQTSPYSREQIVDRMNEAGRLDGILNGRPITTMMLDAWCAESKPHMLPAHLLPLFCWASGSGLALKVVAEAAGAAAISGDDMALLQWARAERASRSTRKQARKLAAEAGIDG